MRRKVPKSIQAIIITFLVGMFLPKLVSLTGVTLVDKVLWKIMLTVSFNMATIIVGVLYSVKLIHGKVDGGKARITLHFAIIVILLCTATSILAFIKEVAKWVLISLSVIALLFILAIIVNYLLSATDKEKKFKRSQAKSVEIKKQKENAIHHEEKLNTNADQKIKTAEQNQQKPFAVNESEKLIIATNTIRTIQKDQPKRKTIYELWFEKNDSEKCLTVTNDENPDLRWVKIYHAPYGDGKFYGYVMMMNARNTVHGEIYFADEPIWMLYKG